MADDDIGDRARLLLVADLCRPLRQTALLGFQRLDPGVERVGRIDIILVGLLLVKRGQLGLDRIEPGLFLLGQRDRLAANRDEPVGLAPGNLDGGNDADLGQPLGLAEAYRGLDELLLEQLVDDKVKTC